jgi:phosphonate transport system ATP-binding protein
MTDIIETSGIGKTFPGNRKALEKVSFRIEGGEMVALIGASGSGKSTLLRCLSGLMASDPCDSRITILGKCVQKNGKISVDIRQIRQHIGFVFQQFNLVNRLPLIINVMCGALGRIPWYRSALGIFLPQEFVKAKDALRDVGLLDCAWQRAGSLSGGQQQRAAIARALMQDAKILLADEPIASLDPASSHQVMMLLKTLNETHRLTVIVSLHQVDFALRFCKRAIVLRAGRVLYDGPTQGLSPAKIDNFYSKALEKAA